MSTSSDFRFVIVGGGILGSALAALATGLGLDPLILRLSDDAAPRADTLRNQGLLQSGLMYSLKEFTDEAAYRTCASRTEFAGRDLLRICGLSRSSENGLVCVSRADRIAELHHKAALLNLGSNEFGHLGAAEAEAVLGSWFDPNAAYFRIPDSPFDEAAVLNVLRAQAEAGGATFIEVDQPAVLQPRDRGVVVSFDGREIFTPFVVVVAGAGSFELMRQCRINLPGLLRRTPLMVADAPLDMAAPLYIDLDRHFSAVRHARGESLPAAVVMGTRTHMQPAPYAAAAQRSIPALEQQEFRSAVPPAFRECARNGRFTAGYEVLPLVPYNGKRLEPWIHSQGPVIFGSPGRATVAHLAAQQLLVEVLARTRANRQRTSSVDLTGCGRWSGSISMHFDYEFNDAEDI